MKTILEGFPMGTSTQVKTTAVPGVVSALSLLMLFALGGVDVVYAVPLYQVSISMSGLAPQAKSLPQPIPAIQDNALTDCQFGSFGVSCQSFVAASGSSDKGHYEASAAASVTSVFAAGTERRARAPRAARDAEGFGLGRPMPAVDHHRLAVVADRLSLGIERHRQELGQPPAQILGDVAHVGQIGASLIEGLP